MSGLDNLIAFIDNGGTRSGSERRRFSEGEYMPERRMRYDRRSGADRRRILNKKRKQGKERRTIFVDWYPNLKTANPITPCHHFTAINPPSVKQGCSGYFRIRSTVTLAMLVCDFCNFNHKFGSSTLPSKESVRVFNSQQCPPYFFLTKRIC